MSAQVIEHHLHVDIASEHGGRCMNAILASWWKDVTRRTAPSIDASSDAVPTVSHGARPGRDTTSTLPPSSSPWRLPPCPRPHAARRRLPARTAQEKSDGLRADIHFPDSAAHAESALRRTLSAVRPVRIQRARAHAAPAPCSRSVRPEALCRASATFSDTHRPKHQVAKWPKHIAPQWSSIIIARGVARYLC